MNERIVVVSTIGTSLLTNGASESERKLLTRSANKCRDECTQEERECVVSRVEGRHKEMQGATAANVQAWSAELNGVVQLMADRAGALHYLLHTDTYQGEEAAQLVKGWLTGSGVDGVVPIRLDGMNTASAEGFRKGVDGLLRWCDLTLPDLRAQGYRILFNLSGSFKSLQAYAQTLGMFYADEIVYVFEARGAPLIRIPRLPLEWDEMPLRHYASVFARIEAAGALTVADLDAALDSVKMPEAYLEQEGESMTLSLWGELAWDQSKRKILEGDLVAHPNIEYEHHFREDFRALGDGTRKMRTQVAVARLSVCVRDGRVDTSRSGLNIEPLKNRPDVYSARIEQGDRLTFRQNGQVLRLLRCGTHDDVYRRPE